MSAVTDQVSNDLRSRIVAVLREDRDVRNIGVLADQLEAAIRNVDPVAWLRHGEEKPVQNVPFGAMWISDKDDPRAFPVYDRPEDLTPSVVVKALVDRNRTMIARWKEIAEDGPDGNEPLGAVLRALEKTTDALSAQVQEVAGWQPADEAPRGTVALIRHRSGQIDYVYKTNSGEPFLETWRYAGTANHGQQAPWPEYYLPISALPAAPAKQEGGSNG